MMKSPGSKLGFRTLQPLSASHLSMSSFILMLSWADHPSAG